MNNRKIIKLIDINCPHCHTKMIKSVLRYGITYSCNCLKMYYPALISASILENKSLICEKYTLPFVINYEFFVLRSQLERSQSEAENLNVSYDNFIRKTALCEYKKFAGHLNDGFERELINVPYIPLDLTLSETNAKDIFDRLIKLKVFI